MRLIDADELNNKIKNSYLRDCEKLGMAFAVAECKTVDAVQVLRCKECDYCAGQTPFSGNKVYCRELRCYMDENDFCSHGLKG